ncbi:MAG: type II 3-dehydroquinate dehydratase [Gemmatimonadetes bacterium]|nr:type II 3-dehydroquinate dehydratase [Gemmatimonadota bacterium]
MRLALLNGPNLNLLGIREPALYGTRTLGEIEAELTALARSLGATLTCVQKNGEGELIDAIHALRGQCDGAIINAGAYSHTSLAIRDAFASVSVPFVEVHLTNIHAREPERRHSMLAAGARAVLVGFGPAGYALALRGLVEMLGAARG